MIYAVLGANGKAGRKTATELRRLGHTVRAIVRDRSKVEDLAELGCQIAEADILDTPAITEALVGIHAAQIICPAQLRGDVIAEMAATTASLERALVVSQPKRIVVISDYGAEIPDGTGITACFHRLETALRNLSSDVTFLRSAEHMENLSGRLSGVRRSGVYHSLHSPLTKRFPAVSAVDVGARGAAILVGASPVEGRREIAYIEGPIRYTPLDVAGALSRLFGTPVQAEVLPRQAWEAALERPGVSHKTVRAVTDLYDAHNSGLIDVEPGNTNVHKGLTSLEAALAPFVGRLD